MPDVSQKCTAAEEAIEKAGMTLSILGIGFRALGLGLCE